MGKTFWFCTFIISCVGPFFVKVQGQGKVFLDVR